MDFSDNRESRLDEFGSWEWVVILLFLIAGFLFVYGRQNHELQDGIHKCEAPCVVKFQQPMAEDDLFVDYRHGGTVTVGTRHP